MNDYQGVQVLVSKRGKGHLSNRRKAMAGLNDMIRSSAPGGSIAKPLMLALGALLDSGVLFGGKGQPASPSAQPTTDTRDPGGLLGGLSVVVNKLQRGGLCDVARPQA